MDGQVTVEGRASVQVRESCFRLILFGCGTIEVRGLAEVGKTREAGWDECERGTGR